ncbi:MAG TPA: hypothetical protein DEE98_04150 [Elusimicrobia bacterium]|nr:MAG: hypothetical protein A2278_07160 [Elusimicrobia bacterium RIFOXYA12_FULL_49_49]OGS05985.1 MAG: hypothetical protein A2204_02895 [Elusimicrobia bacterium RIFOXYA1_FULL_47_7]OGS10530.1 MAG: hypothetical protein A2386_05480 [Elusimicrobia bacterium RIFOXYB1_FULL_48_9]OGS16184.1 MAG: hypothetical protein A2251_01025 [Elusimicrobia bacterium RIFOXYA2_FULL_47_53]OGS26617.1 MAG: hypothetical protein A2339_04335 [Elusimicrobia bacterium RIFOXYB12_FULL_50_12]OGS31338.1 MAG: hypothetical protein
MADRKKILLADDEPDIAMILSRYLMHDGYDVTVCVNGKEALEKASAGGYDLYIFDVMMPEINGWEVCKSVKAAELTKNIPVIILTARSQNVDEIMSYECGADEYATKPFDYPELSKTIKKLISKGV